MEAAAACLICCADGATAEFKCPLCPQAACVDCWTTSLLADKAGLRCFDCKRTWVVETLLSAPAFACHRKAILDHAGDVEFGKELALLPACQDEAALQREIRRLTDERRELGTLKQVARRFRKSQASECEEALEAHRARVREVDGQQRALRSLRERASAPSKAVAAAVTYVRRCDEPCRGFVRLSDLACSVCDRKGCRRCGAMLEAGGKAHQCAPDEVATFEERRLHHKLCPSCHVEIHKASGCDQMYCINCHTAFSWSTLAIDRGNIHNPEYFRYLATNAGGGAAELMRVEDVACGELPAFRLFLTRLDGSRDSFRFGETLYACIEHIRARPILEEAAGGRDTANLDVRVAYVNGELDEAAFRSRVKHRFRRALKENAFRELLNFVLTIMVGSARNIAFTPTREVFEREVTTLDRFMDLVEEEYIPTLLDVHGGAVPRDVGVVFTDAFRIAVARVKKG